MLACELVGTATGPLSSGPPNLGAPFSCAPPPHHLPTLIEILDTCLPNWHFSAPRCPLCPCASHTSFCLSIHHKNPTNLIITSSNHHNKAQFGNLLLAPIGGVWGGPAALGSRLVFSGIL